MSYHQASLARLLRQPSPAPLATRLRRDSKPQGFFSLPEAPAQAANPANAGNRRAMRRKESWVRSHQPFRSHRGLEPTANFAAEFALFCQWAQSRRSNSIRRTIAIWPPACCKARAASITTFPRKEYPATTHGRCSGMRTHGVAVERAQLRNGRPFRLICAGKRATPSCRQWRLRSIDGAIPNQKFRDSNLGGAGADEIKRRLDLPLLQRQDPRFEREAMSGFNASRQLFNRWVLEELRHTHVDVERPIDFGDDANCQQRVAPQLEEIVVQP